MPKSGPSLTWEKKLSGWQEVQGVTQGRSVTASSWMCSARIPPLWSRTLQNKGWVWLATQQNQRGSKPKGLSAPGRQRLLTRLVHEEHEVRTVPVGEADVDVWFG